MRFYRETEITPRCWPSCPDYDDPKVCIYCGSFDVSCCMECTGITTGAHKSYYLPTDYPARTLAIMEFYRTHTVTVAKIDWTICRDGGILYKDMCHRLTEKDAVECRAGGCKEHRPEEGEECQSQSIK